ncbi:MAG TPA: radical SAM protein [Candidatus Binataceae bacterium]|nr:radical SAM protein [Candidatus Binataceae bacterium]
MGNLRKPTGHPRFEVAEPSFVVIWETTKACDLACAHCGAEPIPSRNPDELSTEAGRALIDDVAALGAPPPLLLLTGGDPIKRPDLRELIAHAANRHVPVALSLPGSALLTPGIISELRAAGLRAIALSVDGADSAIHDAFRGISGVFARTMKAWEAARKCGLTVQINTTVVSANLMELPKIAHQVLERGAMTWSVFPLVPTGRGSGLERISEQACEDLMNFLYDVGATISVRTTEAHHFKRVFMERSILERRGIAHDRVMPLGPAYHAMRAALEPWAAGTHARRTSIDISAGPDFVFISHTGTVHPSFLPGSHGSVLQEKLGEACRESNLLKDLREPVTFAGRCGVCEYSPVWSGAYALSADALGRDEMSGYVPSSFQDEVAEVSSAEAQAPRDRGRQVIRH